MCLHTVFHDQTFETQGEGWKVFLQNNKKELFTPIHLRDPNTKLFFRREFNPNTWMTDDRDYSISNYFFDTYPTGFHIFLNKEDAEKFAKNGEAGIIVLKVRYKKVVAKGTQQFCIEKIGIITNMRSPPPSYREHPAPDAFHFEENTWKEDANTYAFSHEIVRKVKFRNVTAKGLHQKRAPFPPCSSNLQPVPCIVAKEIFIQSEE